MLFSNCMDPSNMTNLEQREKRKPSKHKCSWFDIMQEYDSHVDGVDIYDQLKTTHQSDQESRFKYYLRIFFNIMVSVVAYAHMFYIK